MGWVGAGANKTDSPSKADRRQARDWVVRLSSGDVTDVEADEFRRWQSADAGRSKAFAEAKIQWEMLGAAAREMPRLSSRVPSTGGVFLSRRLFIGGALAAASVGAVAIVKPPLGLWSPLVDFSADFRTGIGERRVVNLGQDVTVDLSTRTRLTNSGENGETVRLALLEGEAVFAVGEKPVSATAGAGETIARDGRFSLRNDQDRVSVTCLDGTLDVMCLGRQVSLVKSQQVVYGPRGMGKAETVNTDMVTAWQRGVLVFHNQTLRQVVNEVNRYRPGRIVLIGDDLPRRPVAVASFHLDQLDQVASQIEALYGAHARYLPGGVVLLS